MQLKIPPTFEEVQYYCLARRNGIEPDAFIDYYASVGWMVGKKKMKDWQAAIRTWERNRRPVGITKFIADHSDTSWAE